MGFFLLSDGIILYTRYEICNNRPINESGKGGEGLRPLIYSVCNAALFEELNSLTP